MKNILSECVGFQWDEGNREKNWNLHQVTTAECEDVFFNIPLILRADTGHSQRETRYFALGQTDSGQWLFVSFVVRNNLVRVISARDMNERESREYDRQIQRDSRIRGRR
ncbi:MAG: BrnT family toxin [Chloroflexi bacterium]|nr:MAG: BrnT family toxin [Chloroflexota bacterium]